MTQTKESKTEIPFSIKILLFLLVIGAIWELAILSIAFFGADEIDCNLLWCEFKTTRTTIESNSKCSVNGVEINCSEFKDEFPDWFHHGMTEVDGVCPGLNDNLTLMDCIEMAKNGW